MDLNFISKPLSVTAIIFRGIRQSEACLGKSALTRSVSHDQAVDSPRASFFRHSAPPVPLFDVGIGFFAGDAFFCFALRADHHRSPGSFCRKRGTFGPLLLLLSELIHLF